MVSGFFKQVKLKRLQNELDELGWYGEQVYIQEKLKRLQNELGELGWYDQLDFHARKIEEIAK